jgi:hypothetical protein
MIGRFVTWAKTWQLATNTLNDVSLQRKIETTNRLLWIAQTKFTPDKIHHSQDLDLSSPAQRKWDMGVDQKICGKFNTKWDSNCWFLLLIIKTWLGIHDRKIARPIWAQMTIRLSVDTWKPIDTKFERKALVFLHWWRANISRAHKEISFSNMCDFSCIRLAWYREQLHKMGCTVS